MTSAIYYEETQALVQTFSQEDQAYFQDLWDYFNFAGFLYEEKALSRWVTILSPTSPYFCRRKVKKSNLCGIRSRPWDLFHQ